MISILATQLEAKTSNNFMLQLSRFLAEYQVIMNWILGGSILISITTLIVHISIMSHVGGNPQRRSDCIKNLMISIICFASLSCVTIFLNILIYLFN